MTIRTTIELGPCAGCGIGPVADPVIDVDGVALCRGCLVDVLDVVADFPPLASFDALPSHVPIPGTWYACDQPEAPHDAETRVDWRCRACVVSARVSLRVDGDRAVVWFPGGGAPPRAVPFSWLVARSTYWLGRDDVTPGLTGHGCVDTDAGYLGGRGVANVWGGR